MINTEILREYDIRGIYQKSLKLEDVENIAKKISNIISNINNPKIIIGHDGRLSSLEIKNKLIDSHISFSCYRYIFRSITANDSDCSSDANSSFNGW